MAKITPVTRQFVAGTVDSSAIGRAAQPFQVAANTAIAFQQRQDRLDTANARTEVARANSDATLSYNKIFNDIQNEFSQDPIGGQKEFERRLKESQQAITDGLTSDQSRNLFSQTSASLDTKYGLKFQNWTETQRTKNVFTNIETTAQSYKGQAYEAGKAGDISSFEEIQTNSGDLIVASADVVGSAEEIKTLNETITRDNTTAFLNGLMRNNPEEALQVLERDTVKDIYTPQELDSFKDTANRISQENAKRDAKLKQEAPLEWLEQSGQAVPPINLQDPNSFRDREAFVEAQRTLNPDMDIPPLTKFELDNVTNRMRNMNADQLTSFMIGMNTAVSAEMIDDVSRQVFAKNPVQGMALSVAYQAPQVASQMIRGEKLINEKAITIQSDSKFLSITNEFMGNAIADPALILQVTDSSKALYAANIFDTGDINLDSIDTDAYKNAIRETVGDIATVGDAKTLTFRDKSNVVVTADEFEDRFDDLTDSDIISSGQSFPVVGGKPVDAEFIKEWGKLVPIGEGLYNIHLRTSNQYMADGLGNPYVFNFKAVYDDERIESTGR